MPIDDDPAPLLRHSLPQKRLVRKATLLHELNLEESVPDQRLSVSSDACLQSIFKKKVHSYILDPLKAYSCSFFLADLLAGLTIAFVLIPQAIAFCALANVPPIMALTSAVFPVMVYALFGSSKHLAVGPEALSSVLVGVAVQEYIEEYGGDAVVIAGSLTLMVGLFLLLLSVFQAGFIENLLSGHLLTGFVLGVAVLIMIEQTPELVGLSMTRHSEDVSTFEKLKKVVSAMPTAHAATVALGISSLLFLIGFKFLKKGLAKRVSWITRIPEILMLVVITLLLSYYFNFSAAGIRILGTFDSKLASPSIPQFSFTMLSRLLSDVIIITLVGFIECQTVTRHYGLKYEYYPSGNRELFALSMANLIGSTLGAYVTFGSLPRSRIQATTGGKTKITGLIAALIVLVAFTCFAQTLQYLPRAVLAAIVFNAAVNLIEYHEIIFIFHMGMVMDLLAFFSTFFLVFFFVVGDGILLCLLLSVLIILRRTTKLDLILLGYLPSEHTTQNFVDAEEFPEAEMIDGILIMGIRGSLRFYNAGQIRRTIQRMMKAERNLARREITDLEEIKSQDPIAIDETQDFNDKLSESLIYQTGSPSDKDDRYCIILDFASCVDLDSSAAYILNRIIKRITNSNIRILITSVSRSDQLDLLEKSGLIDLLDKDNVFRNIPSAIRDIRNRKGTKIDQET